MAKKVQIVLSHRHCSIAGLHVSSQQFYTDVAKVLKLHEIPNMKIGRVLYSESSFLSAKREYLRFRRKEHIFDICAAPFGTDFFVSWWLGESLNLFWRIILSIPYLGRIIRNLFCPLTYYQVDTALMFEGSIHKGVLEVVDGMSEANGLRALSENERKPVMDRLYKKLK